MLKKRIITALILVAILLAALFSSTPIYWQAIICVMLLAAFYEWLGFCKIELFIEKLISYAVFIGLAAALKFEILGLSIIVPMVCLLWLGLLLFTFIDVFPFVHTKWVKLLVGAVTLAVAGWLIIEIREINNGIVFVLGFFLCVVAADVGAYFSGKRFGKHKLAPKISPGKTVEGFLGGLALVILIFVPILFSQYSVTVALGLLLTIVLTAIVSVGGDLFESKLKRYVGLKDSSQLLPGHGGVLDRVDSLMAGLPVYALGLLMLGFFN